MTKANTYEPKRGTLPYKVIEFLTSNPEEALTKEDIGIKFDVPPNQVHSKLGLAVELGAIVLMEDLGSGELAYRLGKGLPSIIPSPGRHPTLKPQAHAPFGTLPSQRAKPFRMDLASIQIDDDVPLPPRGNARLLEWSTLFARMQVGQSFLVPLAARSPVNSAITRQHKAGSERYELRKLADGLRIWRTK